MLLKWLKLLAAALVVSSLSRNNFTRVVCVVGAETSFDEDFSNWTNGMYQLRLADVLESRLIEIYLFLAILRIYLKNV